MLPSMTGFLCLLTEAKKLFFYMHKKSQISKVFKIPLTQYITFHHHSFQQLSTVFPFNSCARSVVIQHLSITPCNQEKQITWAIMHKMFKRKCHHDSLQQIQQWVYRWNLRVQTEPWKTREKVFPKSTAFQLHPYYTVRRYQSRPDKINASYELTVLRQKEARKILTNPKDKIYQLLPHNFRPYVKNAFQNCIK